MLSALLCETCTWVAVGPGKWIFNPLTSIAVRLRAYFVIQRERLKINILQIGRLFQCRPSNYRKLVVVISLVDGVRFQAHAVGVSWVAGNLGKYTFNSENDL